MSERGVEDAARAWLDALDRAEMSPLDDSAWAEAYRAQRVYQAAKRAAVEAREPRVAR